MITLLIASAGLGFANGNLTYDATLGGDRSISFTLVEIVTFFPFLKIFWKNDKNSVSLKYASIV